MPQPHHGLMRVAEPNEAQQADKYDPAKIRVTVTEEREQPANDGGFDEIQKVHMTFYSNYDSNYSTGLKANQPCGEALLY
jgi:hypothetical protein